MDRADVLSHIGPGAVIMHRRLDDGLAGRDTPDDFAPGVWGTWNTKAPTAQRDDALVADAALLARIDTVTPDVREAFTFAMGPITLGFGAFVGAPQRARLPHLGHRGRRRPRRPIPPQFAALVVDNLELIARDTAKPTGDTTTITVATTEPARGFTVELTPGSVTFTPETVQAAPGSM